MKEAYLLIVLYLAISIAHGQAQKKIILEKFTATACGNCPNGTLIINDLMDKYPEIIPVFHHVSIFDPMRNEDTYETYTFFSSGTPTAVVNRLGSGQSSATWEPKIQQALALDPVVDISFSELNFNPDNRMLTLTLGAEFDSVLNGDYRFNLLVLEDNVSGGAPYSQRNYYNESQGHPLYGLGHPIVGYQHMNVCRMMLGGAMGVEGSLPTTIPTDSIFSYDFSVELPDSFDLYQINLVGWVNQFDGTLNTHSILNANEVKLETVLGNNSLSNDDTKLSCHFDPDERKLTVRNLPIDEEVTMSAFDLQGKTIWESDSPFQNSAEIIIPISNNRNGYYILKINSLDRSSYCRF